MYEMGQPKMTTSSSCLEKFICQTSTPHGLDKEEGQATVLRRSCAQVGRGLAFLHASGIVHGNLCSSSVLLRKSTLDRRGFIAKIGAPLPLHNTPPLA